MPIDTSNKGALLLLSKVNSIFRTNLKTTDVNLSLPLNNINISQPARNTTVTLTYRINTTSHGRKTISYDRLHVSKIPPITITKGTATKISDLLEQINSKYNLSLTIHDIIDRDITDIPDGESVVELPISPNSYIFYTGDQVITSRRPNIEYEVGTIVSHVCKGADKYFKFSDGRGGYYYVLEELDCVDCLYELVPPTTPITTTTTSTTSTSTSTTTTTTSTTTTPTTTPTPSPTSTVTETPETTLTPITTTATPTTTQPPTTTAAPVILGLNWITTDVATGYNIVGVMYDDVEDIWITLSSDGIINISADLLTFTTNTSLKDKMADMIINDPIASMLSPDTITGDVIKVIDGIYFVSGTVGWLYTSTDLTNWNAVNIYDKYGQSYGYDPTTTVVKISNDYVAAIRYGGSSIGFISSTDGVNWNQYTNDLSTTILNDTLSLDKIVRIGSHYYANTINYPKLFHSTDGITWTVDSTATGNVKAIASSGSRLVTILNNNYQSAYSDDNGDTWTISTGLQSVGWVNQNNSGDTQIQNIIYANDRFIAVGSIINTVISAFSLDGVTWTKSEDLGNYDLMNYEVTKVVYGNNKLVLSSGKKKLAVSPYIV